MKTRSPPRLDVTFRVKSHHGMTFHVMVSSRGIFASSMNLNVASAVGVIIVAPAEARSPSIRRHGAGFFEQEQRLCMDAAVERVKLGDFNRTSLAQLGREGSQWFHVRME
jgi:hypothetical protein